MRRVKKIILYNLITLLLGYCYKAVATIDTQFCLINSTDTIISVNNISLVTRTEWEGPFRPENLISQEIMPFSSNCWPLSFNIGHDNHPQFDIGIKTNLGSLKWRVKQEDAINEIGRKYDTLENNTNYYLQQKAGDNNESPTNVFILEYPIEKQVNELSDWMKSIPDYYTLKSIELIGTHDSGINMQDGTICTWGTPSILATTQSSNLMTQLTHGIRYFDIRLETGKNNQHYPYHKKYFFGCLSKMSFEQSLNDIVNFIKKHNSETVFLKISHTSSSVDSVIKMLDKWVNSVDTGNYFYKSDVDNYNWVDKKMSELRGKIVLLLDCEYANFLAPQKGYFSFSISEKAGCNPDSNNKIFNGGYSDTKYFPEMRNDQLNKLKKYGIDKKKLFFLSWILTGGDVIAHVPRPTADLVNLANKEFGRDLPQPNIVSYDFEDPGINEILIANFKQYLGVVID